MIPKTSPHGKETADFPTLPVMNCYDVRIIYKAMNRWIFVRNFPTFSTLHWTMSIRKAEANQVDLKWDGMHKLGVYADDVNILSWGTHTKNKNIRALLVTSKAISQEVYIEKIKYMVMFRQQHAIQNILKNEAIHIFANKPNQLKLHSWKN